MFRKLLDAVCAIVNFINSNFNRESADCDANSCSAQYESIQDYNYYGQTTMNVAS